MLPEIRSCPEGRRIDYRTRACVGLLADGCLFDDTEHHMAHRWRWHGEAIHDRWLDRCRPWLTQGEYAALASERAARERAAHLKRTGGDQPSQPDDAYGAAT